MINVLLWHEIFNEQHILGLASRCELAIFHLYFLTVSWGWHSVALVITHTLQQDGSGFEAGGLLWLFVWSLYDLPVGSFQMLHFHAD